MLADLVRGTAYRAQPAWPQQPGQRVAQHGRDELAISPYSYCDDDRDCSEAGSSETGGQDFLNIAHIVSFFIVRGEYGAHKARHAARCSHIVLSLRGRVR